MRFLLYQQGRKDSSVQVQKSLDYAIPSVPAGKERLFCTSTEEFAFLSCSDSFCAPTYILL